MTTVRCVVDGRVLNGSRVEGLEGDTAGRVAGSGRDGVAGSCLRVASKSRWLVTCLLAVAADESKVYGLDGTAAEEEGRVVFVTVTGLDE